MKRHIALALIGLLVLGATSCSRNSGERAADDPVSGRGSQVKSLLNRDALNSRMTRSPSSTVANLPDRGELVGYPAGAGGRMVGAYTWYRTSVSEAHAQRAVYAGKLTITTPKGALLRFDYQRHVEHPSGDWTWVGHLEGGGPSDEILLTFGARAVFGSIAQSGYPPLRLTTRSGITWLVETDAAKLPGMIGASARASRRDYLLPPPPTHAVYSKQLQAIATPALKGGASTVDLLVGYTPGFASAVGGASAAVTRINHLVEINNLAYQNSQVPQRLSLVHAMQVAYPDNTGNGDALEKLTGFVPPSTQTPPDPAFSALRAAREQYKADLVSLVRSFRNPENQGCGIAWLIGGGQTPINSSHSYFGYSVVSDGQDGSFFCREETLAHELGHNMGAQHDLATARGDNGVLDSDEYGRYPYSFGYKTGAGSGNFFTVMAYGDSGQTPWRVFSNPNVNYCGGAACGIANQIDNARTLTQTIPLIAAFREGVVPPVGPPPSDFDGDGRSDLLWRNTASGENAIWRSASSGSPRPIASVLNLQWRVVAVDDFDGDELADILWRNSSTGANSIWRSANAGSLLGVAQVPDFNWRVVGTGDFDGDGNADILWRNFSTGVNVYWRSANSAAKVTLAAVADFNWVVAGVGDMDGDNRADILWRNGLTGANFIWNRGDANNRRVLTSLPDRDWRVVDVADFGNDGQDDILWRNFRTGGNAVWNSGASSASSSIATVVNLEWDPAAVGDFDGDGRADLVWRNMRSGANVLWRGANATDEQAITDVANLRWITP